MGAPRLAPGELGRVSAKRLPNGRWRARARLGTLTGTKQIESNATTRKLAVERLTARAVANAYNGGATVTTLAKQWINNGATTPQTKQRYATALVTHIEPALGTLTPEQITPVIVDQLLSTVPIGVAPTVRTVIQGALTLAIRRGMITTNPVTLIPKPTTPAKPKRAITPDELTHLKKRLTTWENNGGEIPLTDIVDFMAGTGVRPGEMLALTWDNVNLNQSTVDIVATQVFVTGAGFIAQPHTKRGKRTRLTLPRPVVDMLAQRAENRPNSPWVFPAPRAPQSMVQQPNLNRAFRQAKGSEFKWVTWRTFRYTVAQLVAENVGTVQASKALTHSTPATTRGHYLGDAVELAPNVTSALSHLF